MGAERHVPATIISNSFISDLPVSFNNLLNREILSALTRQSSATAGGSKLCFTLNYLSRRSNAKADHLSTLVQQLSTVFSTSPESGWPPSTPLRAAKRTAVTARRFDRAPSPRGYW